MKKRFLIMVIAIVLVIGLVPSFALAASAADESPTEPGDTGLQLNFWTSSDDYTVNGHNIRYNGAGNAYSCAGANVAAAAAGNNTFTITMTNNGDADSCVRVDIYGTHKVDNHLACNVSAVGGDVWTDFEWGGSIVTVPASESVTLVITYDENTERGAISNLLIYVDAARGDDASYSADLTLSDMRFYNVAAETQPTITGFMVAGATDGEMIDVVEYGTVDMSSKQRRIAVVTDPAGLEVVWSYETQGIVEVVEIDGKAYLNPLKNGDTMVTATLKEYPSVSRSFYLRVEAAFWMEVDSVAYEQQGQMNMGVGETITPVIKTFPVGATLTDLTWSSNDTGIVTVDENGKITAVSAGKTYIEGDCYIDGQAHSYVLYVTVLSPYTVTADESYMAALDGEYIAVQGRNLVVKLKNICEDTKLTDVALWYVEVGVQVYMEGFTFDSETRTLTIPAELVTGNVAIHAQAMVEGNIYIGSDAVLDIPDIYPEGSYMYDVILSMNEQVVNGVWTSKLCYGDSLILEIWADCYTREGYTLVGWNTEADGSGDAYAITDFYDIDGDFTLYAIWEPVFTVTPSDRINNGSVTVDKTEAKAGDTVTITVTPNEGYELDTLTVTDKDGNLVALDENNSFVMPEGDVTVTATFKVDSTPTITDITFNSDSHAYNAETNTFTVSEKHPLVLTATGENLEGAELYLALYNSNGRHSYAIFTCEDPETFVTDINYSKLSKVFQGWEELGWPIELVSVRIALHGSMAQTGREAEIMLNVVLAAPTVEISAGEHGSVSVSDAYAKTGDTVTVTVTPDEGYVLDALAVTDKDGNPVAVGENNSFVMPEGDVTVTATFKVDNTPRITGITFNSDSPSYNAETNTFAITEESPLIVTVYGKNWIVGDEIVLDIFNDNGTAFPHGYTITGDTETLLTLDYDTICGVLEICEIKGFSSNLIGVFATLDYINEITLDINLTLVTKSAVVDADIENGSATVSDAYAKTGDTVTVTVTPDEGYELDTLTVTDKDGNTVPVDENNSFVMPEGSVAVTANFRKTAYTLIDELEQAIQQLETQLDALGDTYATDDELQAEIQSITSRIDGISAELEGLKQSIPTADVELLQNELSQLKEDVDKIESTYATKKELEEAVGRLDELTGTDGTIEQISSAIALINEKLGSIPEGTNISKILASLDSSIEALTIRITSNETGVSTNAGEISSLKSTVEDLATELRGADETLTNSVNGLSLALTTLTGRVDTAEQEIDKLQQDLSDAIKELDAAVKKGEADLSAEIATLNTALTNAKSALEKADADNKAELIKKIEEADIALDDAIKAVQKNLDDAKTEIDKAIKDGDTALDTKITNLNTALTNAVAALEQADTDNKAELVKKIEEADASLQAAIDKVAYDLATAQKDLADAIATGDSSIASASASLSAAKEALEKADADNKAALEAKIEAAEATLDAAIKAVQKNLDDAKAELNKAIADGNTELDGKISALNEALATAKAALETTDSANKSDLTTKIDEADAALQAAINALSNELNATNEKVAELKTFIIIVCVISGVAFCGCGTLAVFYIIDKKKKI